MSATSTIDSPEADPPETGRPEVDTTSADPPEATAATADSSPPAGDGGPPKGALADLLRPIRGSLALAVGCQALSSAAALVPFVAIVELARELLQDDPDEARVWAIVAVAGLGLVGYAAGLLAAGAVTHLADNKLQLIIRRRLVARLREVPLGWFTDRSSGQVKKAVQDDVATIHHLSAHALNDLVAAVVTPVLALGYLLWVDWRMTLVTLAGLPVMLAIYAVAMRGYQAKMVEYNRSLERVNASIVEFVQGIAVVKTFGQARRAHSRYLAATNAYADYFGDWARAMIRPTTVAEVFVSPPFVILSVLVGGTALVGAGAIEPIDVLPFLLLGVGLTAPLQKLQYGSNDLRMAREAAGRVSAVLAVPLLPVADRPVQPAGQGVGYDEVSFSYVDPTGQSDLAVRQIGLVLRPGTVTALVGPSGSGKSTLARLLPRFYDTTAGAVRVGTTDVRDVAPAELYRRVGFVFQDVQLLAISIRDNIVLGREDVDDEQVVAAARAAQIHDRIEALPRGYDSVVGDDARLSGGEAQRVSIARALLADPPVLVLDEATAFTDPESEAAIQDALSELAVGRTVLVVAHRLSTITGVDQIVVLDAGVAAEHGRHEQLLAANGLYARLWAAHERATAPAGEANPS